MGCTHAATCPLHPHLSESLAAWREHYCNADTAWADCARYKKSLRGEPIPLALLPNGKLVGAASYRAVDDSKLGATAEGDGAVATATAAAPAAVAVLSDDDAMAVINEAKTAKRSFWKRFTNLFGVS